MTSTANIEKGLAGLRVAVFEGRRAKEMEQLILKQGGVPLLAPSMAEAPLSQNVSALEFGEKLLRHNIAVVLFLTGVGAQSLFEVLETRFPKEQILRRAGTNHGSGTRAQIGRGFTRLGSSRDHCCSGSGNVA